ncbi:DUF2244 domain-containing protein [Roseococcus sp. YIM B11640]|uniref:DUF2244 domain-containing protein n=1 Tax=Roseococcus sp. YIM B11640 TaxID=3133973 RepID=UPI003C7B9599
MAETPTLFEARSAPLASLDARGFRLLAGLMLLAFTFSGTVVTLMGAWPVMAFGAVETGLVIALLAFYRWRAQGSRETVTLMEGRLTIRRRDGKERVEKSFDPFWARLHWQGEKLFIGQRRDLVEIGRFLSAEERQDFASCLEQVLRRYREPVFDNPQLRD